MSKRSILVAVDDATLGGTSRSAIMACRAWRAAGYRVHFYALRAMPPEREAFVAQFAEPVSDLDSELVKSLSLVHLHHLDWTAERQERILLLMKRVRQHAPGLPLLSHNVFAVPDGFLNTWPGPRAVGVLGRWAAHQYVNASGFKCPRPFVVPNPQDTEWFRPPTTEERTQARSQLELGNEKVILRPGSPSAEKWTGDYIQLAERAEQRNIRVVAIGAPQLLADQLRPYNNVSILSPISDETLLRKWYWASDTMALSAKRGESFGNVLMEAMLCGDPTVYRARPRRDNTPWEFQDLPLFTYCRTADEWVQRSMASTHIRTDAQIETTHMMIHDRYGIAACGKILANIEQSFGQNAKRWLRAPLKERSLGLSPQELLATAILHNPAGTVARRVKARLRSA